MESSVFGDCGDDTTCCDMNKPCSQFPFILYGLGGHLQIHNYYESLVSTNSLETRRALFSNSFLSSLFSQSPNSWVTNIRR